MSDEEPDLDTYYTDMRDKANDRMMQGYFQTAADMNADLARAALTSGHVMHYIYCRFHQMDQSQYTLQFEAAKQCAVELIAVMEDEDRARQIQSEFPQEFYEYTQQWMTACLYENLADVTGMTDGYNSPGMHQCIGDGIQVCRRTGKMQCISCFREYACDVYLASDDLLMARNQCESNIGREKGWSDRGDRRWFACKKVAWIHLLEGQIELAKERLEQSLVLCEVEGVTLKLESKMRALAALDTVNLLSGLPRVDWSLAHPEGKSENPIPDGQWATIEWEIACNNALEASCQGRHEDAIAIFKLWDRRLTEAHATHLWFELRLRLIATMILNGDNDRASRLAQQLKDRATQSSDFLTLRRLEQLTTKPESANPIASLEPMTLGPFAGGTATSVNAVSPDPWEPEDDTNQQAVATDEPQEPSPMQETLMGLFQQFFTAEQESDRQDVIERFLSIPIEELDDIHEVAMALHLCSILAPNCDRPNVFWEWGLQVEQRFNDDPSAISMVAVLGENLLAIPDSPIADHLDEEDIVKRHQLALSMDPNRVGNHLRAGEYFLAQQNEGEAERCLARAFRLDRTCVPAAMQLSEVYRQTDRFRDALEVLDICLRQGVEDPNLAMEATTMSLLVGHFESTLTYADQVCQYSEEHPEWVDYYRAVALLELDRADEAMTAIDAESTHDHSNRLHLDLLRECIHLTRKDQEDAIELLGQINAQRLADAEQLTQHAMIHLTGMLWTRLQNNVIPVNHIHRQRFTATMLQAGLMPDEFFDQERTGGMDPADEEALTEVNCYRCIIAQPLDENWADFPGCLAGQAEWENYLTIWSVLATDEEDAQQRVEQIQSQCYPGPCEFVDLEFESGPYRDCPGILSQGLRWAATKEE